MSYLLRMSVENQLKNNKTAKKNTSKLVVNVIGWFKVIGYVNNPLGLMTLRELFNKPIVADGNAITILRIEAE